jgi:UPF0755 protein
LSRVGDTDAAQNPCKFRTAEDVKFKFLLPKSFSAKLIAPLVLVLLGVGGCGLWWRWAIAPVAATPRSQRLNIVAGTSADAVGQQLEQAGLIRSQLAWKIWARWLGWQDPQAGPQTGTFAVSAQASLPAIAEQIWHGNVLQTQFTIPEGWSIQQMAAYFQQRGWFSAAEFEQATRQIDRDRYPWLPAKLTSLEGWLYPDTYQLPVGRVSPPDVINLMLDRFQTVALPLYKKQPTQLSLQDWVTLSSIVEKEAVSSKERPVIAGVFFNRLRQNTPLGSDPTVEYGLGVRQTPDQPLTFAQVKTPSPYNTYLNPGLPPTAIASPGLASLSAVLQPAQTNYLFFVARYDGTHVFSHTLAEHEAAQEQIHRQREAQPSPS